MIPALLSEEKFLPVMHITWPVSLARTVMGRESFQIRCPKIVAWTVTGPRKKWPNRPPAWNPTPMILSIMDLIWIAICVTISTGSLKIFAINVTNSILSCLELNISGDPSAILENLKERKSRCFQSRKFYAVRISASLLLWGSSVQMNSPTIFRLS